MPRITGTPPVSGSEKIGKSSLLRAKGTGKKVGFFTALLSRKVNKFIAKTIPEQVSAIDKDIGLLKKELEKMQVIEKSAELKIPNAVADIDTELVLLDLMQKSDRLVSKSEKKQIKSLQKELGISDKGENEGVITRRKAVLDFKKRQLIVAKEITSLEAKKELITGVGELHTEIEEIIGEDRNLLLHYVAGFSDKKETWDAVDTIAYKVIQNQEKLPNFIAKFAYCMAKFVVKIALSGARKEGYKLSQEEMVDVQKAVAKFLNTQAGKKLDTAIDGFLDVQESMNAKQKGILKKTIIDTIAQVNETLGGQENPSMLVVSVAVKLLKATGDAGVKDAVLAQMPVLLKGALASEFVKGKTDGLLEGVTPQELAALVEQGMDSSADMLQDLVTENPQLVGQNLDLSVDKVKQALKDVKQELGGKIIALIKAGDQKGLVKVLQKIGVFAVGELEAETKPVDKLFNILSAALARIDNQDLAKYIDITLKKHVPDLLIKALEGKKPKLDVLAPILGGSAEDIQAKKEMLDAIANIVQAMDSEKASTEDFVSFVEKLLDQFEGSPDAKSNAIGSALAIQFDKAMVQHDGDITEFPAYLKAHKAAIVASTGAEKGKQGVQAVDAKAKRAERVLGKALDAGLAFVRGKKKADS